MTIHTQPLRGEDFILSQLASEPVHVATRFLAADGYELGGLLVRERPTALRANLVINSGTGIPKEFYLPFARHMAHAGFQVLVYDYRGVGESRPSSLRGFEARMQDWGRLDMPAALEHLSGSMPELPTFALGHSVGGQLLGLLHNHHKIRAAAFVACSTGYWGDMPRAYGAFCAALWYGFVPLTTSLLGYAPAKSMHLGEDLPRGVVREWGEWCKKREYFADLKKDGGAYFFDDVRFPIKSLGFADDPIANPLTIAALQEAYTNVSVDNEFVVPGDVGLREIGHLGFFSRRSQAALWNRPLSYFESFLGASA